MDESGIWRCGGRMFKVMSFLSSSKSDTAGQEPPPHKAACDWVSPTCIIHNWVKETLTKLRSEYWLVKGRQFVRKVIPAVLSVGKLKASLAVPILHLPSQSIVCNKLARSRQLELILPARSMWRQLRQRELKRCGCAYIHAPQLGLYTSTWSLIWLLPPSSGVSDDSSPGKVCHPWWSQTMAKHLSWHPRLLSEFWIVLKPRNILPSSMSSGGLTSKGPTGGVAYLSAWLNLRRGAWRSWLGGIVSYDELLTLVIEVEAVLNSQPLTYISSEDVEEPLTPSHLLVGYRILTLPDSSVPDDPEYSPEGLTRRMRYLSWTFQNFWDRWKKEYLLELRELATATVKIRVARMLLRRVILWQFMTRDIQGSLETWEDRESCTWCRWSSSWCLCESNDKGRIPQDFA